MTHTTSVGRLPRDARRQREAARELLAECRRDLHAALAEAEPDPTTVLELTVQERLLRDRLAPAPAGRHELRA